MVRSVGLSFMAGCSISSAAGTCLLPASQERAQRERSNAYKQPAAAKLSAQMHFFIIDSRPKE